VFAAQGDDWLLPMWTQAQYVGAVAVNSDILTIDTDHYDFGRGKMLLLWESYSNWQLIGFDRVNTGANTITLTTRTRVFSAAWLIPVVNAFIPKGSSKPLNGHNAKHRIIFQVTDPSPYFPAAAPSFTSTLGTADIFYDESLLNGDTLEDAFQAQITVHDEDIGLVSHYAPWLFNRLLRSHNVICETRVDAWNLRQWLYQRAGKLREFYQPSFENDLRSLSTGTVTNTLDVAADEIRRYGSKRSTIAVETAAGWYPAQITSTTAVDATKTRLNLDRSLGIAASAILRVCWLGVKRLNADSVDINWIGGGVSAAEIKLLEIRS
jgi:hypothetical protein